MYLRSELGYSDLLEWPGMGIGVQGYNIGDIIACPLAPGAVARSGAVSTVMGAQIR